MSIEDASRIARRHVAPAQFSPRRAGSGRGGLGALVLAAALALTLGTAPAAAKYKSRHHGAERQAASRASAAPFTEIPKGPLQIFISIDQQKLHLYSDGVQVAQTSVATGVPSLPTPLGVFSVIQKQVFHRSNIYSNAPMPFMQRITWSGVAMHEGEGIGHRASHGCIRMPHDFAVRLYHLTKLGVPVIIARPELKPVEFADPHLFVHRDRPPPAAPVPAAQAAPVAPALAAAPVAEPAAPAAPAVTAVLANPVDLGLRVSDVAGTAAAAAAATAKADPTPAAPTPPAPSLAPFAAPVLPAPNPAPVASLAPPAAAAVPVPPVEPADLVRDAPASRAPIAVFISRKEKKIYVRQDFAPLFSAPVTIADPDKPLGTHVFTALGFAGADRTALRWNVVSLPGEPPAPPPRRETERQKRAEKYRGDKRRNTARETLAADDLPPPQTPAEALARIDIPQAARDFIAELIGPGSSVIVSDQGLGEETGEGTNFIVVAR